jgi:hypothetical protein
MTGGVILGLFCFGIRRLMPNTTAAEKFAEQKSNNFRYVARGHRERIYPSIAVFFRAFYSSEQPLPQ